MLTIEKLRAAKKLLEQGRALTDDGKLQCVVVGKWEGDFFVCANGIQIHRDKLKEIGTEITD
jgi:hypothetical protein